MTINFVTPTKLSLIDITSMGDSSKRDDPNKTGQFDSGLKYAIALLLRDNVGIKIDVLGEDSSEEFRIGTYREVCESTGKQKELIQIEVSKNNQTPSIVKTGFAKALGYNWELWMSLRELWSNMLDEDGYITENPDIKEGTIITLEFDESNGFYDVWNNRDLYIYNSSSYKSYPLSKSVTAIENPEGYIRIYKQDILVYENKDTPSKFAYNIKFGEIDERRILSNVYHIEGRIASAIMWTDNEEFLRLIITEYFETDKNEFLVSQSIYDEASDLIHNIAVEVYEEFGDVKSYNWLIQKIKERKDCKIKGKTIKTVEDSLWSYSKNVSIESKPEIRDLSLKDQIEKHYNIEIKVELRQASLKGSVVVADKYEKCLIVDNTFDIDRHMPEFIVEYVDLTEKGNVISNLSMYICKLLKR